MSLGNPRRRRRGCESKCGRQAPQLTGGIDPEGVRERDFELARRTVVGNRDVEPLPSPYLPVAQVRVVEGTRWVQGNALLRDCFTEPGEAVIALTHHERDARSPQGAVCPRLLVTSPSLPVILVRRAAHESLIDSDLSYLVEIREVHGYVIPRAGWTEGYSGDECDAEASESAHGPNDGESCKRVQDRQRQ